MKAVELDGRSRRLQKKTFTGGTPTLEGYIYDGWNVDMISQLDPANQTFPERKWSCVWRPDVGSRLYARSSWQKAGGVGGLAWMQTGIAQTVAMYTYQSVTGNAEVHIPMMDHMGNVRHYYQIKSTGPGAAAATVTGQVTANLDYDAFGREVRATGPKTSASGQPPGLAANDPWVDNLPFHFSTKFTDRESGLNYYGYRFYDPVDGRWLNRDPIAERGGKNLYGMVRNNPVSRIDYLGLYIDSHGNEQVRPPAPIPGGGEQAPGPYPNSNCLGHACGSGQVENDWEAVKKRYNCTRIECPKLPSGKADCAKKPCKEGQHQIILFGDKGKPEREFDHFVSQEDDGQYTSQDGVMDPTRPGTGPIFNNIIDPSAHWVDYWKKRQIPKPPVKPYKECYCCDKSPPPATAK